MTIYIYSYIPRMNPRQEDKKPSLQQLQQRGNILLLIINRLDHPELVHIEMFPCKRKKK